MASRAHVLLLICVACSHTTQHPSPPTPARSTAEADAIRQTFRGFVAAKLARDLDRELTFVTDDAVYTPAGMAVVAGKAAVRAWWASREAADSLEAFELTPGGDRRCRRPRVRTRDLGVALPKPPHGAESQRGGPASRYPSPSARWAVADLATHPQLR